MEATQNTSGMMWYNYNTVDGLITTSAPVQVELGTVDIARQLNQQVQLQYGNLQAVPSQTQPIIVAHQPQHPSTAPTPELTVTPKTPKPRARASNGERVPCIECGKTFSCNANLRDHMRLHTGERPFVCGECGMSFAQRSNWRLHKRVHTGERPYMCGICGKTFSRSSHLPGHMRIHTGERPYSCDLCENTFGSAQGLKNHARTHTGEKPFVCEYCQTAFTHSSSLSSHKKRCTGEKRKRGRPLGSGRRSYRKKPTGRPRGRPRKKTRYSKRGRRKNHQTEDGMLEPKEEDGVKEEANPDCSENFQQCASVQTKQEKEDVPTVIIGTGDMEVEEQDPLSINVHHHQIMPEENHIIRQGIIHPEEVVSVAAATAGLTETTDLHQEAAVAMAALHEGPRSLVIQQLPQEAYAEKEGTQTHWFPKQQF